MAGITATGTGSGIDIEGLITKLMDAEKVSLTKLDTKKTALESKISSIGKFKSLIYDVQAAAAKMMNSGTLNGIKATVGNADAIAVVPDNTAASGSYMLDVLQLASAQRITSASGLGFTSASQKLVESSAGVATARISLSFGLVQESGFAADATRNKTLDIKANANGEITLQNVADAINGGKYGVTASLITDKAGSVRLSLSGEKTGAENAFKLDVAYLDASNQAMSFVSTDPDTGVTTDNSPKLSQLAFNPAATAGSGFEMSTEGTAKDSKIKLNGVEISRAGNTLEDVIDGVAFDLKAVTTSTTTVTLKRDSGEITTQFKAFVDAYNALNAQIRSTTAFNASTKTAGELQGEAAIRGIQGQMRGLLAKNFGENGNSIRNLSGMGISFQKDGSLALSTTKLKNAVESNLDGVLGFLGAFDQTSSAVTPESSKDGFAYQLQNLTKSLLADGGLLNARIDGLNKTIEDITSQKTRVNTRLESVEKRYRAQFTAMDVAIASMKSVGDYVTQLLNMNNNSSS